MNKNKASQRSPTRRYIVLLLIWCLMVGSSLLWALFQETQNTIALAEVAARANINKDISFRRWATSHGGVYVPPTAHTPPNPYLDVPERDVVTTTGKKLTLMNPAYMLRELQTDFPGDYGDVSHITSLNLLNPKNAPDTWEAAALRAFEQGEKVRQEVQIINGQPVLRMMRPMIAEAGCLKCHAVQGYKLGEVRGGLSTTVALTPYLEHEREIKIGLVLTHGTIWLLGLFGLGFTYRRDRLLAAELPLRAAIVEFSNDAIIGKTTGGIVTSWNKSAEQIYGYSAEEMIGKSIFSIVPDSRQTELSGLLEKVVNGEVVANHETERLRKDGTTIKVALTLSAIKNTAGKTIGISTIARDITEKKRLEEELRKSEMLLQATMKILPVGLWILDADGKIIFGNEAGQQIWSGTRYVGVEQFGEYKGWRLDSGQRIGAHDWGGARAIEKGETCIEEEIEIECFDGTHKFILNSALPIRDSDGKISGAVIVNQDITVRKKAERELRDNEHFLDSLIEHLPNMLFVKDAKELRFLRFNKAGEELLGYSRGDLIGKNDRDFFPQEQADFFIAKDRQIIASGEMLDIAEEPIDTKNRGQRYLHTRKIPIYDNDGSPLYLLGISEDITERKRAEFVLRQSEEMLKEAQRIAHLGSWYMDLATNEVYWSEELYNIYGFDPALPPPLYTESMKLFTPDSWEKLSTAISRAVETGTPYELELETTAQVDGGSGWMLARGELVRDAQGAPVRVRGVVMNITARKHAEEELRRSEKGLAEAQRMAHLGNWNLDLLTNVLTWSDEIYRIFEIDPEKFDASYEAFLNAIHPDDRDLVNNAYTESLKNKTPYKITHRLLMRDGRIKYIHEKCETYYDQDGKPLRSVGTVHDITAQKQAELEILALNRDLEQRVGERTAQLEAANKELEAFSYSVSHDLRTPLRAIDGFSHILLEDFSDKLDAEGQRLLNVVRDNTQRMGQLIDDILKFSRTGRVEMNAVGIDMERQAREVFAELLPGDDHGKLQFEIEAIPPFTGDSAMMRQVFVNLLSNAVKFSRAKEHPAIKVGAYIEGNEAVYYVKDNGAGFDMQYAGKLFGVFQRLHSMEEFEGTGIGLAIVKRIITRHGGRVWAEGKVGEGATFYFALPVRA